MGTQKLSKTVPTKSKCLDSLQPFGCILKSLIRSLECPEGEKFILRFDEQLERLTLAGGVNISVRDLADLIKLISLTFEKMDENPGYSESFYKLIRFSSQNLVFITTSDMITYAEIIQDFFSMLGYLLGSSEDLECISYLLDCIVKMVRMAKKRPYLQKKVILDAFASSQIPPIITELLYISEFHAYVKYLITLEKIFATKNICQVFIKCNIFNIVMPRICLKWKDEINYPDEVLLTLDLPPHLNLTQRILWTLTVVYNGSSENFKNSIGNLVEASSWRGPRNVLITLITSNKNKHMRNMFYLLLRTIAGTVPYHHYKSLRHELHLLAFTTEVEQLHPWAKSMILRPDRIDFEFKLMLISILCMNTQYPLCLNSFRKMNALQGIFTLIDTDITLIWSKCQRLELMKAALIGMDVIITYVIDDYIEYEGPAKLLKALTKVLRDELHLNLLLPILRCINTSLSAQKAVQDKIVESYRMNNIIDVLTSLTETITLSKKLTKFNLCCLALTYCILEKIVKPNEPKLNKLTQMGVIILKRYINPGPNDSFLQPKVLIALMSFMWENLVYCGNGISEFTSSGGVYVILDVIEKYPLAIKILGLSIIANFCQIPEFLSSILTWRAKSGQTVLPFLLTIYKEQAQFDKDHTDSKSTLQDLENPILGDRYNNTKEKYLNNEYTSFAALDFLGNCKPKIYTILTFLSCCENRDLVDSTYRLSKASLTNEDKIVLVLAENYLPLSIGESWSEVQHHLQSTGVRPLVFDQELIAAKLNEYRQRTKLIQIEQYTSEISEKNRDICVERQFYKCLQDQALSESLDALQELRYYSRCVDAFTRLRACTQLAFETQVTDRLDKSLLVDFHNTLPADISVTPHFNQHVNIQSNVIIDPNKEELPDAVSLDSIDAIDPRIKTSRRFADFVQKSAVISYEVTRTRYSRNYSVDFH